MQCSKPPDKVCNDVAGTLGTDKVTTDSSGWTNGRGALSVFAQPRLCCGERLLGLDCEMVRTERGFDAARISIVDASGQVRSCRVHVSCLIREIHHLG